MRSAKMRAIALLEGPAVKFAKHTRTHTHTLNITSSLAAKRHVNHAGLCESATIGQTYNHGSHVFKLDVVRYIKIP